MNSLLPNMRWLTHPSSNLGQDWFELGQKLDSFITREGLDLAEEALYLLYSALPLKILEGEGECLVARSVIGPKKVFDSPCKLIDWVAAPVWRERLTGVNFEELIENAQDIHIGLLENNKNLGKSFIIAIQRGLSPSLTVDIDVLFYE